jgi:DNA-binding CsgD family transcriptional regulator
LEVGHHLAAGLTLRESLYRMNLSAKTVDTYKTKLMRKLNVHNRASLVRSALQRGLFPIE